MDSTVDRYEVTKGCYVPVGTGTKFKHPGAIVTLDSVDAEGLKGYVKKASKAKLKGRSKLNTPVGQVVVDVKPDIKPTPASALDLDDPRHDDNVVFTKDFGEVTTDGSEPSPADERAGNEDDQRQGSV